MSRGPGFPRLRGRTGSFVEEWGELGYGASRVLVLWGVFRVSSLYRGYRVLVVLTCGWWPSERPSLQESLGMCWRRPRSVLQKGERLGFRV